MQERWETKDGSLVIIDSVAYNGRLKIGSVYSNGSTTEAARCIWDSNTGQCWGKDGWDLSEEIKSAPTER